MDKLTDHKPAGMGEATGWAGTVALVGFILVATAQASNMILARGLAGSVPPFALAFFRWSIIFLGLAPIALAEIRQGRIRWQGTRYRSSPPASSACSCAAARSI
jgi:drug/metabolite transporter (DMT)-like permease